MNSPPHTPASDPADLRWATLAEAETLGQPLPPHDLAFLRMHVPADPALRVEHALRDALEGWGEGPLPDEDDEAVLAAAVDAHLHETSARARGRGGRVVWLAAAGLAAAAAVVLAVWLGGPSQPPSSDELARVDAPARAETVAEPEPQRAAGALRSLSGTWVDDDGTPLTGTPAPGIVLTASSAACLGDEAGTRLCVEPGARVRAVATEDPAVEGAAIEWLGGRGELTMPATPAPRAMVLELRVAGMRVTGLGASVAVEATVDGHWSLTVREGEVSLHTPEGTRSLTAGERWTPTEGEPMAADDQAAPSRAATPDAATLLRQARSARTSGSMGDAAALYRRLLKAYPRSPSAGPAWVALGQVELARGRASAALGAFEHYLERGGPLAEEAAYGRIEALRKLGRTGDERAAIERFLAKYPGSSYAAKLRQRP
jgi:Tetratricopeptide repeat